MKPWDMMRRMAVAAGAPTLSGSAFNPADKNANITLSNGDHTALSAAGGWKMVRGTSAKSSGLWYAEFAIDAGVTEGGGLGAGDVFVGVDNGGGSLSSYPGSVSTGRGWYCRSDYYGGSNGSPSGIYWGTGRVIGIAYNATLGKIWFSRDGVWVGDPVANTGVAMTSVPTGQKLAFGPNTNGAKVTLRTSASDFSYPIPSGYSAWG